MNIKLEKNTATSRIDLEDDFVLQIITSKYEKTVKTTASMFKRTSEGLSAIDFTPRKSINHGIVKRLTKNELVNCHNFAINYKDGKFFLYQKKIKRFITTNGNTTKNRFY
jgi:hypothetical protein